MTDRDLGEPTSFYSLTEGSDVFASDGEKVGEVAAVFKDEAVDIFDGIEISLVPLGRKVYAHADLVDEIYERGVVLTVDELAAQDLPEQAGPR